jgi:hypothetical protein
LGSYRLYALPRNPRRRVELLGTLDVARYYRVREPLREVSQQGCLLGDVLLVLVGRLPQLGAAPNVDGGGLDRGLLGRLGGRLCHGFLPGALPG